jgi:O-antigen ligase
MIMLKIKELLLIKDSTANKISYYFILLFLLSLPFDRFYSHLIMIGLFLHTLIHLRKSNIRPVFTWENLALQSIFLLTVISTFYSADKTQGYQEAGKQAFILLIPLLFCLNPIELNRYRNNFFGVFSIGCTLAVSYLFLQALVTINYYRLPLAALFSTAFINHNFSEPFDIHATYFSMQLSLALVYLLSVVLKSAFSKFNIFLLCCCCILTAGIIQLGSKSVYIALLLIFNLAVPYFLMASKKRFPYFLISGAISVLLFAGIYKTGAFKTRYISGLKNDLGISVSHDLTDPRLARWKVALGIVVASPLVGHGAGSETELLKTGYFQKKLYYSYLAGLNAHNEFLSLLIKSGVFGLIVYLVTLGFGIMVSIRNKDLMYFTFVALIFIVSFSENLLDVDKGIIYYAFFFSLLYFSSRSTAGIKTEPRDIILSQATK